MFAAHNKLDNLVLMLDNNNLQIDGHVTDVCSIESAAEKFRAFGWNVLACDGHSIPAIREALTQAVEHAGAPTAIVCKTVKGKGVSFMEDQVGWHGNAPSAEQAAVALAEIDAAREQLAAKEA